MAEDNVKLEKNYEYAWDKYSEEELKEVFLLNERYINFMSNCKTERECIDEFIKIAEDNGYKSIDDVSADDFDALLIPGGYSPDQLRADNRFLEFTRKFAEEKKPIFTICHGPQLLINAELVKGKKMTSVSQVGVDLKNAGANWVDEEVVKDDSGLITSRTPDDLPAFNKAILEALEK